MFLSNFIPKINFIFPTYRHIQGFLGNMRGVVNYIKQFYVSLESSLKTEFNNVTLKCVSNWSKDRNSLESQEKLFFLKPELNTKLFTYAYQFAISNPKMIMTKMVFFYIPDI